MLHCTAAAPEHIQYSMWYVGCVVNGGPGEDLMDQDQRGRKEGLVIVVGMLSPHGSGNPRRNAFFLSPDKVRFWG
jgi:hypothetical protein